jgi:hypothetical protein
MVLTLAIPNTTAFAADTLDFDTFTDWDIIKDGLSGIESNVSKVTSSLGTVTHTYTKSTYDSASNSTIATDYETAPQTAGNYTVLFTVTNSDDVMVSSQSIGLSIASDGTIYSSSSRNSSSSRSCALYTDGSYTINDYQYDSSNTSNMIGWVTTTGDANGNTTTYTRSFDADGYYTTSPLTLAFKQGDGSAYDGSNYLVFEINDDYYNFKSASVDGVKLLEGDAWNIGTDNALSCVLILYSEYLDTLADGTHTLAITTGNGTVSATFTTGNAENAVEAAAPQSTQTQSTPAQSTQQLTTYSGLPYNSASGELVRTIQASSGGASVTGSLDLISLNTSFTSEQTTSGDVYDFATTVISNNFGANTNFALYNMVLKDASGMEVHEINGEVNVTLPIPAGLSIDNGKILVAYRVNEDGSLTKCNTAWANGYLTFATNHFSTYAIVEQTASATTLRQTSPKTGETNTAALGMILFLLAASAYAVNNRRKNA